MDTQTLIKEAKARFSHNLAKVTLKEKYKSKLIIAEQNGLWIADPQTIAFLSSINDDFIVLLDTFDNPVEIDRKKLLESLKNTYNSVMLEWYQEWKEIEQKR